MEDSFIDKIRQIILNHIDDEKFGVNELASKIGLSKSQALRKLKSLSNKSINQFIKETRLQEAAKLILNSNLLTSEISYKVGFSSPSYFNKCFRKYYGFTPGEYKEKYIDNPPKNAFDQTPVKSVIKNLQTVFYILGVSLLLFVSFSIVKNIISPPNKSIAILYFDDHSPDADLEWLCDQITEEITEKLNGIKKLNVSSRTSVKQFRNSDPSIPKILKALGVDYIVEGSVTMGKDSVRIIAQLINANNEHLWSKDYNDKFDNIFSFQQNAAKQIANQLKITLSPEEIKIIEKYPTDNKEAYNLFLQAEYQKSLFNKIAYNKALPIYKRAIALDTNFVEAYMGLAEIWQIGGIVWGMFEREKAWKNANQLLLKAKSINGTNNQIEYDLHLGYFYYKWDFDRMEKYYQTRLLKSNYNIQTGVVQDYAMKTGRFNEALLINERYIENSPKTSYIYAYKAEILMFLGKNKEALEILNKYRPVFNDNMFFLRESSKLYFYLEDYNKSKIQLKKIRDQFPDDNPPIFVWLDAVYAQLDGNKQEAAIFLDQLKSLYENHSSGSPAWFIAIYYGYYKDYENTFIWLQRSFDRHEVEMTWLREEPILIPLHNDMRYKNLYHKIGFSKIE